MLRSGSALLACALLLLGGGCKDQANTKDNDPVDTGSPPSNPNPNPPACADEPPCTYDDCADCFDPSDWYADPNNSADIFFRTDPGNYGCQENPGIPNDELWNVDYDVIRGELPFTDLGLPFNPSRSQIETLWDTAISEWTLPGSTLQMTHRYEDAEQTDPPGVPITWTMATALPGLALAGEQAAVTSPVSISSRNLANEMLIFAETTTAVDSDGDGIADESVPGALNYSLNGELGTISFYEVLLHEMGHAVGFEHSFDPNSIMWEVRDDTYPRDLSSDDGAGLAFMYTFTASNCLP